MLSSLCPVCLCLGMLLVFFFFNDTATTEIYTLSLHDALPIRASRSAWRGSSAVAELIVAFDLPSGREALELAARLPGLRWAKIGPPLHVREGPALVREFTARGVRVFLDLKWHDIPSVVAG